MNKKTTVIDQKQVKHIAKLANLELTQNELNIFQAQLGEVISYFNLLEKLNTESTPPTSQITVLENILREDKIEPSLTQKEALSNVKDTYNGYFMIKSIFI